MWRQSGHPGYWLMGGNLAVARCYGRYLQLQIKALEEGLATYLSVLGPDSRYPLQCQTVTITDSTGFWPISPIRVINVTYVNLIIHEVSVHSCSAISVIIHRNFTF